MPNADDNKLVESDMLNLVPAKWPSLLYLDLSQNTIGSIGAKYLASMSL